MKTSLIDKLLAQISKPLAKLAKNFAKKITPDSFESDVWGSIKWMGKYPIELVTAYAFSLPIRYERFGSNAAPYQWLSSAAVYFMHSTVKSAAIVAAS